MSEAPKKRWYVVQAFSGFEGRVATSLREHIKLHNMEDLFGEVMVPTEEVVEIRGGQRRKSERKFFPGYVLVQMVMNDASWHLVRSVPRVMGFIGGTSDRPAPISDKEVDAIMNRLQPPLSIFFSISSTNLSINLRSLGDITGTSDTCPSTSFFCASEVPPTTVSDVVDTPDKLPFESATGIFSKFSR